MHIYYHGRQDDTSSTPLHHSETIDLGQLETLGGGGGRDSWVTTSSNTTTSRTTTVTNALSQRLTTVAQWHAWMH